MQLFELLCHPLHKGSSLYSYFTIPTIVSAGPDSQFGLLDLYMTPDGTTASTDNLYSFLQR